MISYRKGNLLDSNCDIICHQVNLFGVMSKGLALRIAKKWPRCEREYKEWCQKKNVDMSGKISIFEYKADTKIKYIANCFSQRDDFSTNSKWLSGIVADIHSFAENNDCQTIGISKSYGYVGINNNTNRVIGIWEREFAEDKDIKLEIWDNG